MITGQALEIVLSMARELHMGRGQREDVEMEAIKEVEFLLTSFEDTGNYTEDDYMEDVRDNFWNGEYLKHE